jgi:hypothetical protein
MSSRPQMRAAEPLARAHVDPYSVALSGACCVMQKTAARTAAICSAAAIAETAAEHHAVRTANGRMGGSPDAIPGLDGLGVDRTVRPQLLLVADASMRPRTPPYTPASPWPTPRRQPRMASVMPSTTDIVLAECDAPDGRQLLVAELDELTLTYTIVARSSRGRTRALRRHVPSLRDARAWASAYRPSPTCLDDA